MSSNSFEEGPQKARGFKNWLTRHKVLVLVLAATLIVLVTIGIVLGVVLGSAKSEKIVEKSQRIDCVPWLKGEKDSQIVKEECDKIDYCDYNSIDNNQQVPSCFYQKEKLSFSVTKNEMTQLGLEYTIQLKNSQRMYKNLKVIFEFLDDYALRFKVNKII